MTRATDTPEPGPAWRTPLVVGVVLLAAVAVGLAFALLTRDGGETGMGATPSPTPTETADPTDTPEPTESPAETDNPTDTPAPAPTETPIPGPTPAVQAPSNILPPGSVARVVVDGLRIRDEPTTGGAASGTLARGDLVEIGAGIYLGPIEADGYTWYPVVGLAARELPPPSDGVLERDHDKVGWVAASSGGSQHLELLPPRCVDGDPDLALLDALTAWERLACFGDRELTFEGTHGCGGCGGFAAGTFEPGWLAYPMSGYPISVNPQERIGPFGFRLAPDGPAEPEGGAILRVTGRFDHPAARGCTVAPGDPPEPADAGAAELYCRSMFVVESYEVIGFDENFPFG
jgi:hypothetical protein